MKWNRFWNIGFTILFASWLILFFQNCGGPSSAPQPEDSSANDPEDSGDNFCDETHVNGIINVGSFQGHRYMMMPSGCDGSTHNPICRGCDIEVIQKAWNDGDVSGIQWAPGVEEIQNINARSTVLGDINQNHILAVKEPRTAAEYCADMSYGGYTDWYLPSKSELTFIFCQSTASDTSLVNAGITPQEDPGCVFYGKSQRFSGFDETLYWTSTAYYHPPDNLVFNPAWAISFQSGYLHTPYVWDTPAVRCIRRSL